MAEGFVFLPSFYEAIKELPDDQRLACYDAVVNYGLFHETIPMSPVAQLVLTLVKPAIDSSQAKYRAAKENGSKPPKPGANPRGRPRKNQSKNQTENQSENQELDKEIDKENDKENDTEIDFEKEHETDKKAAGSCVPPTKAEVELFLFQNKIFINPDRFYASCSETGWGKIWNWQDLARHWAKSEMKADENKFRLETAIKARERGLID